VILFIVTSAINGDAQRLHETRQTIESIHQKCPVASVLVLESSFERQDVRFPRAMVKHCESQFIQDVRKTDRDVAYVKNAIELHTTINVLHDIPNRYSHIFKISGRYTLTDHFNLHDHVANKATFAQARATGYPFDYVGTDGMLMTRLYSFCYNVIPQMLDTLEQIEVFFHEQWNGGKVFDMEHGFYKFLPRDILNEVGRIGVRGRIGHLTSIVED